MELKFKTIIYFVLIIAICGFWMAKCTHGGIGNAARPDNEEVKGLYKSYSFKAVKNAWMSIDDVAERLRNDDVQAVEKFSKEGKTGKSKKEPKVRSMFYYKVTAVIGNHKYIELADRETILISIVSAILLVVFLITSGIFMKVHSVKDISFNNAGFNYKNEEE